MQCGETRRVVGRIEITFNGVCGDYIMAKSVNKRIFISKDDKYLCNYVLLRIILCVQWNNFAA